jgi:hypothetical protein
VSEAWRAFVFDPGACRCQNIKCPGRGSRCGSGGPVRASSEAEPHPRGRPALERGRTSPEGATNPRARRNLTRGGDRPLSEAEPHPRRRPALERGEVSFVRCRAPRANCSFARGGLGLTVLVGRWGRQVHGPLPLGYDCVSYVLYVRLRYFAKEMGFPPVV